jgi:hypothetical protein
MQPSKMGRSAKLVRPPFPQATPAKALSSLAVSSRPNVKVSMLVTAVFAQRS